ncbi:hypothetical protein NKH28_11375 [Mesorhizobium sp. M1227]|uniref:hypothetical protein n=1 Tax=Mesorhizobium sp. M1227 TaxID=2957071 RepID=UPI00333A1151
MGNLFLPDFSGPFTKQELPVSYRPGRFRAIPKTSQTIMTPMIGADKHPKQADQLGIPAEITGQDHQHQKKQCAKHSTNCSASDELVAEWHLNTRL